MGILPEDKNTNRIFVIEKVNIESDLEVLLEPRSILFIMMRVKFLVL